MQVNCSTYISFTLASYQKDVITQFKKTNKQLLCKKESTGSRVTKRAEIKIWPRNYCEPT